MVDRQLVLGAAMIILSFPLRSLSKTYFAGLGVASWISTYLFTAVNVLGVSLLFFVFFRWRVARVRAKRAAKKKSVV